MALVTPIGTLRVFADGKPIPCELSGMEIDEKVPIDGKFRLTVHFKANDNKRHLIMCCLKINQEVTVDFDPEDKYTCSVYRSAHGKTKVCVAMKAGRKGYDGRYVPDNNGEDGFYYDIYMTFPEIEMDTFSFGVAWQAYADTNDDTELISEAISALTDEPVETVSMFDADDEHTEDYGVQEEEYYQCSALGGNRSAMVMLGYMYEEGSFGRPDFDRAIEYFQMALEAGDTEAEEDIERLRRKKEEAEASGDNNKTSRQRLGGEIRNSKESGNDAFSFGPKNDDSFIAVIPLRWEDRKTIWNLLGLKDGSELGVHTISNENDERNFMFFFNDTYEKPYPAALIIKYVIDGEDRIIVDVGEEDLDVVNYIRSQFM